MMRYRPPPKDEAARLYQKFTKAAGVEPRTGETPAIVAARIGSANAEQAPLAERITELYLDVRYGVPRADSLGELQAAVSEFASQR